MTPTRFNFLWNKRAKARTRLEGRLFVVKTEARSNAKGQSFTLERVICIDMQKALPLALLAIAVAYAAGAATLDRWLEQHSSQIAAWTNSPPAIQPQSAHANHTSPSVTALAESVEASTRKRIELVDNETAFFKNLDALQKVGANDEILSNLSLTRRRSPPWFLHRQTELAQLEVSINARQGDLLALRGAASAYLNGTIEHADIMTASAKRLIAEKRTDAALALLEEIIRKAPDYSPAKDLLKDNAPPTKNAASE